MFITKKKLNNILEGQKTKYEAELLYKEKQITMLEIELSIKEIKEIITGSEIKGDNHGTK